MIVAVGMGTDIRIVRGQSFDLSIQLRRDTTPWRAGSQRLISGLRPVPAEVVANLPAFFIYKDEHDLAKTIRGGNPEVAAYADEQFSLRKISIISA
jgi:hypothetical protein